MKKKILIISIISVLALVITGIVLGVTLSKPNETDPKQEQKDPNKQDNNQKPVEKVHLDVPKDVNLTNSTLTWDAVENATSYTVYIGEKSYVVEKNEISLAGLANNKDRIYIVANGKNGETSLASISRIFIEKLDEEEAEKMYDIFVENIYGDFVPSENVKAIIDEYMKNLFMEGVESTSLEKLFKAIDDLSESFDEFKPKNEETYFEESAAYLLEQLKPFFEIEVEERALAESIRTICLILVEESLIENEELAKQIKDTLNAISNEELEKLAFVVKLSKQFVKDTIDDLPAIFKTLDKLSNGINSFDDATAFLVSVFESKDLYFENVKNNIPTYEEYSYAVKVLDVMFKALLPEYVYDAGFDEVLKFITDGFYNGAVLITQISDVFDADYMKEVVKSINNIKTLIDNIEEEKIMKLANATSSDEFVDELVELSNLSALDKDQVKIGLKYLINDVTKNDAKVLSSIFATSISKVALDVYSSLGINPTFITSLTNIVTALGTGDEFEIFNAINETFEIQKYFGLKEGYEFSDLQNHLKQIDKETLKSLFNDLKTKSSVDVKYVLEYLEIDQFIKYDVVKFKENLEFKVGPTFTSWLSRLLDAKTEEEFKAVLAEKIDFEAILNTLTEDVKKGLNLTFATDKYAELIDGVIKNLGIDYDLFEKEIQNIYNLTLTKVLEFANSYEASTVDVSLPDSKNLLKIAFRVCAYSEFGKDAKLFEDALIKATDSMINIYTDIVLATSELNKESMSEKAEKYLKMFEEKTFTEFANQFISTDTNPALFLEYIRKDTDFVFDYMTTVLNGVNIQNYQNLGSSLATIFEMTTGEVPRIDFVGSSFKVNELDKMAKTLVDNLENAKMIKNESLNEGYAVIEEVVKDVVKVYEVLEKVVNDANSQVNSDASSANFAKIEEFVNEYFAMDVKTFLNEYNKEDGLFKEEFKNDFTLAIKAIYHEACLLIDVVDDKDVSDIVEVIKKYYPAVEGADEIINGYLSEFVSPEFETNMLDPMVDALFTEIDKILSNDKLEGAIDGASSILTGVSENYMVFGDFFKEAVVDVAKTLGYEEITFEEVLVNLLMDSNFRYDFLYQINAQFTFLNKVEDYFFENYATELENIAAFIESLQN